MSNIAESLRRRSRLSLALLASYAFATVFSGSVIICGAYNFGKDLPFPYDGSPIPAPTTPAHNSTLKNKWAYNEAAREHEELLRLRADYLVNPRTNIILPFAVTFCVSAIVLVAGIMSAGFFYTSFGINVGIGLSILHAVHLGFVWQDTNYRTRPLWPAMQTLGLEATAVNSIMLLVIITQVILHNVELRLNKIRWPRCNCLSLFTFETLVFIGRLIMCVVLHTATNYNFIGRGMSDKYSDYLRPYPPAYAYILLTSMVFYTLTNSEAILSVYLGVPHRKMIGCTAVVSAVMTGFCAIVTSPVFIRKNLGMNYNPGSSFEISSIAACLALLHGVLSFLAPSFLTGPPNVLVRFRRPTEQSRMREDLEIANRSSRIGSLYNRLFDQTGAQEADTGGRGQRCVLFKEQLRTSNSLLRNLVYVAVSAVNVITLAVGISLESYYYYAWPGIVLLAPTLMVLYRALTDCTTEVLVKRPVHQLPIQVLVQFVLEGGLILAGSVGAFIGFSGSVVIVASALSMVLAILQGLQLSGMAGVRESISRIKDAEDTTTAAEDYTVDDERGEQEDDLGPSRVSI